MGELIPVVSTHCPEAYSYDFGDFYFGLSLRHIVNSAYTLKVLIL
jgi:hypothetical protein